MEASGKLPLSDKLGDVKIGTLLSEVGEISVEFSPHLLFSPLLDSWHCVMSAVSVRHAKRADELLIRATVQLEQPAVLITHSLVQLSGYFC